MVPKDMMSPNWGLEMMEMRCGWGHCMDGGIVEKGEGDKGTH